MPIDDPKTPFHEEISDEEMDGAQGADDNLAKPDIELDPMTDTNLTEAQRNKLLNSQTNSGVVRQTRTVYAAAGE